jgi:hypothetical protein
MKSLIQYLCDCKTCDVGLGYKYGLKMSEKRST